MFSPITSVIVLLYALLPILAHAAPAPGSCGQVVFATFGEPKCVEPGVFSILEDTRGVKIPLNKVKSLGYSSGNNTEATDCKPIQFMFYNENGQTTGTTYITPGRSGDECVDFLGSTVASYSGVTVLA